MTDKFNKPIEENYPDLDFSKSRGRAQSLNSVEGKISTLIASNYGQFVYVWNYGYHIFSEFIEKSVPDHHDATIAAFITEVHSSIRGAYLLNLAGYHGDSAVLLRKSLETSLKALSIKKKPGKVINYINENSIQPFVMATGINAKRLSDLLSTFTHSNKLKIIETALRQEKKEDPLGIAYGPQKDTREFHFTTNSSILILYLVLASLPYLFEEPTNSDWLEDQKGTLILLKDYLSSQTSDLIDLCDQIDNSVNIA